MRQTYNAPKWRGELETCFADVASRRLEHNICSNTVRYPLLQLAKLLGVRKVIALVGSKQKIELVRRLGADFAVDYSQKDWTEQVLQGPLIAERTVETLLLDVGGRHQILNRCGAVAVPPEHVHGLVQSLVSIKFSRSRHRMQCSIFWTI